MMPDPIEQVAAAGVVVPAPFPVNPASDIGHQLRRPDPCLVVQFGRRGAGQHILGLRDPATLSAGQADFNPRNLPDQPIAHDLGRLVKRAYGSLPGAGLPDAVVGLHGPDNGLLLGNGAGERFLSVNVLLLPGGLDGRQRVPMIRHGQHDRVNIPPGHQLAVILIRLAALVLIMAVDLAGEVLQMLAIHIAGGDHPAILQGQEGTGVAGSHAPAADHSQGDARGGSRFAGTPQRRSRDEGGERER